MKKKLKGIAPEKTFPGATKILLKMKLTLCVILISFLGAMASESYSQTTKLSLDLKNAKVKDALGAIENQSEFFFLYSEKLIDVNREVNIEVQRSAIEKILDKIFEGTNVNYTIKGRQIVLATPEANNEAGMSSVSQQQKKVTGKVTDSSSASLPGVSVLVKGTTTGVITDSNGNYSLSNVPENATLQFSFVGMKTQEIAVAGKTDINITLDEETVGIEEVVAIGYSTQKKVSLTSSVAAISGKKLAERTVTNIQQTLQGQLPGLTVIDLGAAPGRTNYTMRVRGITTLGNNNPLVIVDGIEQSLDNLNPIDIESVSVLKDASSTAIYGSRAANGVILITTKRAKSGKLSVSYNGYYALQKSNNNPTHMDTEDYMNLQNIAFINSTGAPKYTEDYIKEYVAGTKTDPLKYPLPNTWYQTVFHVAPQVSHSLSVSGGNETIKAVLSLRNQNQDGIIPNSSSKINEMRLNVDYQVSRKITLATNFNYRNQKVIAPVNEGIIYNRMLQLSQFTVPKYPDGTYGISTDGHNPLLYAENAGTANRNVDYLTGDIKGEWEILKGLKFSVQLAGRISLTAEKNFTNSYLIMDYFDKTKVRKSQPVNSLTEVRNDEREFTMNNLLNYTKDIGAHSVNILAGYSQIQNTYRGLNAYRQNFYNNDIQSINQGAFDATKSNGGNDSEWGLRSFFGRLNYAYQDRYLLEANARYDGSSRFTGDNQYSFFPSFSAGWRISQENFWSELKSTVNELKLRASQGSTGNQAVGLYSYIASFSQSEYNFGGVSVPGYGQTTMANKNLTWETTYQTDLGLDAQFLNNRISFSMDYYNKRTEGILLTLPVPGTLGLNPSPQNAGRVDNKGWEFLLGTQNSFGDFGFNGNINLNINDNMVVDLAGTGPYITTNTSQQETRFITQVGYPINSYWGYITDGYFQTDEEVANYPNIRSQIKPGDVKFIDLNGDKMISPLDMTYLGRSFPKYTFSSSLNFTYKNFALTALIQGASGYYARVGGALAEMGIWGSFTSKYVTNNYWTPENRNSRLPRPLKSDNRNINFADRDRINGAYLRLKNIQLSYKIPSSLTKRIRIEQMSIFVATTNLLTFSDLNELEVDPESVGRTQDYPQTSLTSFGLNINF